MKEYKEIEDFARKIRYETVRMIYEAGDGHPGPALSIADIVAALYVYGLNIDPHKPDWPERDRLILSKGHACPVVYAALSEKGYLGDKVEHFHLRELGSAFQGHPVIQKTPGIDMTSGSLGNGIAIGAGMALAAKYKENKSHTFVICGDGELNEGIIWEGVMTAAKHHLNNLSVFVDNNRWQSGGSVSDISGLDNLASRFQSFGWDVMEIDGHNYEQIVNAIDTMKSSPQNPTAVIAHCIKGKGLPYMEDDNEWHKKVPTKEQFEIACKLLGGIE